MREYSIAAIPADGIGPEVIEAGATVFGSLQNRDLRLSFGRFDWSSSHFGRHGVMMPEDGLKEIEGL